MTLTPTTDRRFDFDAADRLRKALRESDVSVQEMADYLEVSRNSVSAWINGRNYPRRRDLAAFARKTGYPIEWLRGGDIVAGGNEMQPSDYRAAVSPCPPLHASTRPRARMDRGAPKGRTN